jgi:hypothetical protein
MFSSFAIALTICLGVGTVIVIALAARAKSDVSIARVLYEAEHPEKKTR